MLVVANDEKSSNEFMKIVRLGKRKRLAHIGRVGLAQGVVPAFDMVGLGFLLAE